MFGRRLVALVASGALLAVLLPGAAVAAQPGWAGGATAPVTPSANGVYVVQMADQPVVAYTGGVKGLKATAPKKGQKVDPRSSDVVAYASYLNARHGAAVGSVGGTKLYDYVYSYNGFAAQLTSDQAAKLATDPGVLAVSGDEMHTMDTSSTPAFLGLSAPGGLWDQLGGVGTAGDGIIIGVIDSGISPESLSFTDRVDKTTGAPSSSPGAKLAYRQIPGWHGKCTPGEEFNASMCNQKLIGAQWFNASWGGDAGIDAQRPWEFNSVRDYNGHGSHTSSTAGGNNNVPVTGPAAAFGTISGMAPHARIAMYKALWSTQAADTASGATSDLVAAIDQAVADGVDVINYSISGTLTNFRDPVEISFMYAAAAGIFVAESAGNSGPTTGTVAHPAPWTTTVAAGTHNRTAMGTVTMGDGSSYAGASVASAAVSAPLINSTDAAMAGASATAVSLCYSTATNGGTPALDPAKVVGKIVVCDRGVSARVDKSLAVLEAGGVGMVLVNPSNNSLNADFHSVPTVHLNNDVYAAVHAYAATPGATATISQAVMDYSAPAPYTASFSSRGPLQASPDLLKPDLMAPGQDILAAVAPAGSGGLEFNLYSGTSMSSPHVAGLAALLKQLHPDWTPMAIKSALMTSAYDVLDGPNTNSLVIFRQGAGHVQPNKAADPGLVFDSSMTDWIGFLCGTQLDPSYCTSRGIAVVAPSDFNGASIAIGGLPGSRTVTRTVTNVGAKGTYNVSFSGAGISASVSPATFTLNPGQKQTLQITISSAGATLNAYTGGQLTWTDGTHSVRIPVVARPVAFAAPVQVSSSGSAISYNVTFGYTGSFTADARGLVPATTFDGSINTGEQLTYQVTVPAGATYARFSLFDATTTPGSDLDLVVYGPANAVVGTSGGGTSAEEVNLLNPAAGTYTVLVDGYATANPSAFTLFAWALGPTAAGNMTVSAPASATLGATGAINLSFSGLAAGTKYLGSVAYSGASGMPNPTIVRVDP
ncbi:MAG: S8 family serine peptidase [Chloroflexota bacterium]